MNKYLFLLILAIAGYQAQSQKVLTLSEVVQRAKEQSPSYFRASNQAENLYWNYRQFRANNLPQLRLSATLPNYSSAIERITLDDGTFAFREREQSFISTQISMDQNVALTGGSFSVSSVLQRTDIFSPIERLDYFATPFSVSYSQPVVLYNQRKWDNRIQPLLYQESLRSFNEDMEDIAIESSGLYFNALDAAIDQQIAQFNVSNNDTLYKIAKGRYNLGKIAENDLLQIELNLLNAQNALSTADLNFEVTTQTLKRFLNIPIQEELELVLPTDPYFVTIEVTRALEYARSNRQSVLEFRRRRLEAERDIAQARGQSGYDLNVSANFGVSQQGQELQDVYGGNLNQQNSVTLGLSIPILDWGRAKASVRRAKANRDLVEVNVQQDEVNFEQEIFLQVMQFNMQQQQLSIAAKADTIAQKRYEVTKQRYLTGKITITDLNLAQTERDQARKSYLSALRTYWNSYYTIRRLTLHDFVNDVPIRHER